MKSQSDILESKVNDRLIAARKQNIRRLGDIEHRLEYVDIVNEVEYVNDAKATDLNSTWYSLDCMEKPVIWILSSSDDDADYSLMNEIDVTNIKAFIVIGNHFEKVQASMRAVSKSIIQSGSILDATMAAQKLSNQGDVVLFSPGFSDLENFTHYKDHGQQFRKAVREMQL